MINLSDISFYDIIRSVIEMTYLEYTITDITDNGNDTYTLTLEDIGIIGSNKYAYYVTITNTPSLNGSYKLKSYDTDTNKITIELASGAMLTSFGQVQLKVAGYINTRPETIKKRKNEKSTKESQVFPLLWIPEPLDITPIKVEGSKNNTIAYYKVNIDSVFIMDYYDYKDNGNATDEQIISNMISFGNKFLIAAKSLAIDIDFEGYKPHRKWGIETGNSYVGLVLSDKMAGVEISGLTIDIQINDYCLT